MTSKEMISKLFTLRRCAHAAGRDGSHSVLTGVEGYDVGTVTPEVSGELNAAFVLLTEAENACRREEVEVSAALTGAL